MAMVIEAFRGNLELIRLRKRRLLSAAVAALWLLLGPVSGSADPVAGAATLKIGGIFSLSSYGASYGQPEANASLMAVDEINQAGGVNGRFVDLILEDNRTSTRDTVQAFQKLVEVDKVFALVGPNWAEFAEVTAPLAEQRRIVMLTASGWTKNLTQGRNFVFTTLPAHDDIVRPLAHRISQDGCSEVRIILNSNGYLESITGALIRELKQLGVTRVEAINVPPPALDYRATISRLKKNRDAAVVLVLLQNGENGAFLKQARELEWRGRIYASNNLLEDPSVAQNLGLAEGVTSFDFRYLADRSAPFFVKYRARFGVEAGVSAPRAYDNVFLLAEALKKRPPSRAALAQCLAAVDYQGVTGRIRFNAKHNLVDVERITSLIRIGAGRINPID